MNKYLISFLAFIFIFANSSMPVFAKDTEPSVSADSAVLIDAATGTILYSKNMNTSYPPASTTKVMTALITIENTNPDDIVTVSKNVPIVDGSKIGLFEGEQLKVKDLLYGMLLLSGNDCAVALAEHVSGSVQDFAKLMTARAKQLGCENTNFVNPSGLFDENHKTSAKDLALIMREAVKHEAFKEVASTFAYKIPPTNKHPEGINLANENKLINKGSMYYYKDAEAGKTGYTIQSEHSYVASASRNGQRLIVALIHDKNKTYFQDSINLFNYGFNNFELVRLFNKGDKVANYTKDNLNIPLLASEDYFFVRNKNSSDIPQYKIPEASLQDRSFKQGDVVLEAAVNLNGKVLPNIDLASGSDHEIKPAFSQNAAHESRNNALILYISSALLIIILIVLWKVTKIRRDKEQISR